MIGLLARDMKAAQAWAARHGFVQTDSFVFREKGLQWNNDFAGETVVFLDQPAKASRFARENPGAKVIADGSYNERPQRELDAFSEVMRVGIGVKVAA